MHASQFWCCHITGQETELLAASHVLVHICDLVRVDEVGQLKEEPAILCDLESIRVFPGALKQNLIVESTLRRVVLDPVV